MTDGNPLAGTDVLERALKRILKPVMRFLISKGIAAPAFYRLVKQTYVEAAIDVLGDKATDSRVSVMTGVHRRDVKEFRNPDNSADDNLRHRVSILTTVVGRWLSDADYADANGAPLPLPRSGKSNSFDALVQSVSQDIRPRTVLDELMRQNIVHMQDDMVALGLDALVGPADGDQRLHFFAHNLGDHMAAAVENLMNDKPPLLERAVFYNHLSKASVDEIQTGVFELSRDALLKINSMAAEKQEKDMNQGTGTHRFRFGVFFFSEDETTDNEGPDAI